MTESPYCDERACYICDECMTGGISAMVASHRGGGGCDSSWHQRRGCRGISGSNTGSQPAASERR